jgi:hypothetical protein
MSYCSRCNCTPCWFHQQIQSLLLIHNGVVLATDQTCLTKHDPRSRRRAEPRHSEFEDTDFWMGN